MSALRRKPIPLTVILSRLNRDNSLAMIFAICPRCDHPVSFELKHHQGAKVRPEWFNETVTVHNPHDILAVSNFAIVATFPSPRSPEAPDHTPPDIARIYKQALASHQRGELDGAAILFRKTLEVATKELDPSGVGSLQKRIDALAKLATIPDAVREWAHEIRIVGNDAAHDAAEPSKEDVHEIAEFTGAFLEYTFTMTEKVKNRQSRKHGVVAAAT